MTIDEILNGLVVELLDRKAVSEEEVRLIAQAKRAIREAIERAMPYRTEPFVPGDGNDPTAARYDAISEYRDNLLRELDLEDEHPSQEGGR